MNQVFIDWSLFIAWMIFALWLVGREPKKTRRSK
jgi:hypothetical protein